MDPFREDIDATFLLLKYGVEMNVFQDTSVSSPNKRTVILGKDSQYYSSQNKEDNDGGIFLCERKHRLLKSIARRHRQMDQRMLFCMN